jgi:hypothetical protein
MTAAALMAATALLLAGCAGTGEPDEDDTPSATAQEPSFEGRWQADDPEGAFLEFDPVDEDGGTLTGSDGCNGVGGEFFVDGSTGVDTWLKDVATVVLDGDTMTVQDSEGEDLGTLTRAEDADETAPVSTGSPSASIGEATDEPTDEDD